MSALSLRLTVARWRRSFDTSPDIPRMPDGTPPDAPKVIAVSGGAPGVADDTKEIVTNRAVTSEIETNFYSTRFSNYELWPHLIADLENGIANIDPTSYDQRYLCVPNHYDGSFRSMTASQEIAVLFPDTSSKLPLLRYKDCVLLFPYPAHVSDVRTAFGKIQTEPGATGPALGRKDLPVGDESGEQGRDVVPPISGREAMYDDLALASVFSTISRRRIRYVGIVATDIEDLVFLVRQLRLWCPDVVVFTTSADLRFLHSDVNSDLDGMLVFSTYPLFSLNQWWSSYDGHVDRILQFPSDEAEGVYNATLKQLAAYDRHLENEKMDYNAPFTQTQSPVLWVSVVGHDALWPISFHYHDGISAKLEMNPGFRLNWVPYPLSFQIVGFLLAVFCFVPCFLFLCESYAIQRCLPKNPLWLHILTGPSSPLDLGGENEVQQARKLYVATFFISLLLAYLIGVSFFLLPVRVLLREHENLSSWATLALSFKILVALLIFAVVALAAAKALIKPLHASADVRASWSALGPLIAAFASLASLVIGLWFIVSVWKQSLPVSLLEFVRASNIWSGVSPLHPLLFAGIAGLCMAASNLRWLNLLEECRVKLPFLGFSRGGGSFEGIAKYEAEIVERIECPFSKLPLALLIETLVVVAWSYFIVIRERGVYPIDGEAFAWFFNSVFLAVYVLFSLSLVRFAFVWWSVRKVLRSLYWHPTRTAYEALRRKTIPERPDAQNIKLFEPRPSLTAVEGCLEFARNLLQSANCLGAEKPHRADSLSQRLANAHRDLCDCVSLAEVKLTEALHSEAYGTPCDAIRGRMAVQTIMAQLSALVSQIFEPEWRATAQPSLLVPRKGEKGFIELGNLFVAARVVDFLRQIFPQLLNLAGFSMVGTLAMMLAVSEYPFPGRDTLLWFSWLVLLSVIGVIVLVFVQMNRDRILSMLAGNTPGRLNWNSAFLLQVLIFGVIPILTLLGAQFPHALGGIFSWISGIFGGKQQ